METSAAASQTGVSVPPVPMPAARASARGPRLVAIGGGTGLPAVLDGLCQHASENGRTGPLDLTAVVTVTDEGGSSGRLRQDLGILPPGDVRNCMVAVSRPDCPFRALLQHRFIDVAGFDGHPVGNLLLTALTQMTGDFVEAVDRLSDILGLRARVLPTTGQNVRLRAEMDSGQVFTGETEIVGRGTRIRRLSLQPSARPLPEVLQAIVNADGVVVGPGSLYTSVLPNLLVEGVAATIHAADAVRIYVANLMTEPGETDGYTLDDHLEAIRVHAGFDLFDYILVNRRPPDAVAGARYAAQGAFPMLWQNPPRWAGGAEIVDWDLAPEYGGAKIRHNPRALAEAISTLVRSGRRAKQEC